MSERNIRFVPSVQRYYHAIIRLLQIGLLLFMLFVSVFTMVLSLKQQWHDGPSRVSSITHRMPELDYALLWAAGKMAVAEDANQLYDGPRFLAWREKILKSNLFRLDWIYPPPMIALAMLVANVPLLLGYIVWTVLISGIATLVLRGSGLSWRVVLLGLFGPPTWRGIMSGQYAPLAAALVMAGLLRARKAPVPAGIYLAFASLKPHLGVLVPIVWIAQRRWAAFAIATTGIAILATISTFLFGIEIWSAFLHGSSTSVRLLLEPKFPEAYWGGTASVYWMVRSFGASPSASYGVQFLAALAAVVVTWAAARRGSEAAAAAVAACAISLVSPYFYYSDLVGYSLVVGMLAERRKSGILPMFLWLCPGISTAFAVLTGRQLLPVFVVYAAAVAWRDFGGPTPRILHNKESGVTPVKRTVGPSGTNAEAPL